MLYNRALSYALLSELVQSFKSQQPAKEQAPKKYLDRLTDIIQYINSHYQEQLTLTQVAQYAHLSAPYLSSFFEKYMGMSFMAYYATVRLDHATKELLYTDAPIEEIAIKCGFSDPRGFVRAFKKRYSTVPSAYRKMASPPRGYAEKDPLLTINYLNFKPENYLHILSHYLPQGGDLPTPKREETVKRDLGRIDCSVSQKALYHKWRTCIGLGQAKDLLYGEIQQMVARMQREIGFRYIRFHGILSDDLMMCRRGKDGVLQFSFVLLDKILDFLLSVGLKPMVQFSFMPETLAERTDHTVFDRNFIISPPKKMEEWNYLIRAFLRHVRQRYGLEEIRSWLYSVWNEPDTSTRMFGFPDTKQYYALYENTYRTVKEVDSSLVFGTPSLFPVGASNFRWISAYLAYASAHHCLPEFMDVHYYADDFGSMSTDESRFSYACPISSDPNHFQQFIAQIRAYLREHKLEQLPLYITEWNLTVSHRNLINDTCFKACHLVKNFLENYDQTDSVGYWSVTDFIEEQQLQDELFHGGMGLFTQNGIKKPSYIAMQMLRRLGGTLVDSGDGYFIAKKHASYQMMLYNYEHCNPLFTAEGFDLTATQRDGVFPLRNSLDLSVTLTRLPQANYRMREVILNQRHGSSFDQWTAMGGCELKKEEMELLRAHTAPAVRIRQVNAPGGELTYSALLEPQEVRLVELDPVMEA